MASTIRMKGGKLHERQCVVLGGGLMSLLGVLKWWFVYVGALDGNTIVV